MRRLLRNGSLGVSLTGGAWILASLSSKQRALADQKQNYFKSEVAMIPHFEKRHRGGEDAYVSDENIIAVADGVGGWASKGVDPGIFARELCSHLLSEFLSQTKAGISVLDVSLETLLEVSVLKTRAVGSSTIVLAVLDPRQGLMRSLNHGDSGFMLVRPGGARGELEIVYRSTELQHRFNYPFQCGTNHPPPYTSDVRVHEVKHNDIVVMGSDGLFDNLFDRDILGCVAPSVQSQTKDLADMGAVAHCIAKKAEDLSYDAEYKSPFYENGLKERKVRLGGKTDDITVVVSQLQIA